MVLLVSAGCDDPLHRRRLDYRTENLRWGAEAAADLESGRGENLARSLRLLERQHQRDVANTNAMPDRVGRWVAQDFERFRDRQPLYRKQIEEELGGDPEKIRRTIPDILY